MYSEHKEAGTTGRIDRYLASRDIDGLYHYMQGKEAQEPILYYMLETWSLEKTRGEPIIFFDVFSYQDAISKYEMVERIMDRIIHREKLSWSFLSYIDKNISIWAMLLWVLTRHQGVRKLEALEAIGSFLKEQHYSSGEIKVLEAVFMENLQGDLSEARAHQDGYLMVKLLEKLPDTGQKSVLIEEAENYIRKTEQEIQGRLYTPTVMEKIGEYYMIVDCWHDRVLCSRELCDIRDWEVLDSQLWHPHSICWGKELYAVENTEFGTVCFYKRVENFVRIAELAVGKRPHRLLYDEERDIFWVLGGKSQEIYGIRLAGTCIELCFKQKIEELQSSYVRSMRIINGKFYIVSGPGYILELSFTEDRFLVENKYAVSEEYFSMNDIIYFQGFFWISVYLNRGWELKPALLRLPSLNDFGTERCVDLYDTLGMKGVPYFFSWVDGKLCIPEIDTYSRIVLYDADDGELKVNRVLYDFGKAELSDVIYYHKNDIFIRDYPQDSIYEKKRRNGEEQS